VSETEAKPQGYWRVPELITDLDPETLKKLEAFYFEILRYNSRTNLIPKKTEIEADIVHIYDCIVGARIVLAETKAGLIYDIGSGNGLPGMVMAILDPKRKFILVDTDERKLEFLRIMIGHLDLKNVAVARQKLDEFDPDSISCAVSRGYASMSKILLLGRRAFRSGGEFFHFKSSTWIREVAQIPSQVCTYWTPRLVKEYDLPIVVAKMAIVAAKKIAD
jgi:16S rRNA (guanine527-N7)-methyltransferase